MDVYIHLLPVPIGISINYEIPTEVMKQTLSIRYFLVEKIRTARRYLRSIDPAFPIDQCHFIEIGKRKNIADCKRFL